MVLRSDEGEGVSLAEGLKQLAFTVAVAVGALISVAAIIALIASTDDVDPVTEKLPCENQTCIKEALEILSHTDTDVEPCINFYAFACNNIPEHSVEHWHYNTSAVLMAKEMFKLKKLYNEPIKNNEHELVKKQKELYKVCMNETETTKNVFATVKEILKEVGGWPVVEGANWNETKFDWMETTYKVRQLGYDSSTFLEVNMVTDPDNEDKYIFQVSIPDVKDVYSKWFDSNEKGVFMTDVAVVFGASAYDALVQMNETYQFLQKLRQQKEELIKHPKIVHKTTPAEIQRKVPTLNWLEFISRIVGKRISENNLLLFPSTRHLDEWFMLLQRTSKRTMANYMMWKLVEEVLPYLTEDLHKGGVKPRLMLHACGKRESRSQFCINEIGKRFSPNPMEIMYVRKYLPEKKRQHVQEILYNMMRELVKVAKGIVWMTSGDKRNVIDTINGMDLEIGAAGNYFDDEILDHMAFNFDNIDDNNFLRLLSQANKNNRDWLYSLSNKSTRETKIVWMNLLTSMAKYDVEKNEIDIPAGLLQDPIFNEERPNYLNYASLGFALKDTFLEALGKANGWSNQSKEAFEVKKECLISDKKIEKSYTFYSMIEDLIANILGMKISYGAYNNWARKNQEPPLLRLNYTPKQLFWTTSAYKFCKGTLHLHAANLEIHEAKEFSSTVFKVINNNANVAQDFNCFTEPVVDDFVDNCEIF